MPAVHRSALLPLPVDAIFDVVCDVTRYPEFLPWCRSATVLERGEGAVVAELGLSAAGLNERFTTRNLMYPYERIELHLVSGPFESLEGAWHFKRLGRNEGVRVELDLRFEFAGARALLARAFAGVFVGAADQMVDAFCQRAMALHRP